MEKLSIISSLVLCLFVNPLVCTGRSTILNGQLYEWTHTKVISASSSLEVSWIASHSDYVTFEMKAPTKGYISIGFSMSGGMPGADIILGWIHDDGSVHVLDMFATHNGQPAIDKHQNVQVIGGVQNENGTSIIFRRKWDTCDDEDFTITEDTVRLIWAISDEDPVLSPQKIYKPKYHGRHPSYRGVKSLYMKAPPNTMKFPDDEEVYPEDVTHIDFLVNRVHVPKIETYYHCRIVKFPKLESKHHIIAYRPLIAPASLPYVHHIGLYKCHVPEAVGISTEDTFQPFENQSGGDCYTEQAPREWREYCFEFRVAIGAGSDGDLYPPHLGDLIGDSDGPTYYRLEVHYDNVDVDLIDSTGLRMFYTSTLREHELAIMFAGHRRTPFLTIPPYQPEYNIYGFCGSDCTKQGLPEEGIKIFSVLLHAHLAGRKIALRHIRNGKEIRVIAEDNHYDFNYQHYRMLNEEVTILPGDELVTQCTFDTEQNETFIYGGLSTKREMCESFIMYYPKAALTDCRSQPELNSYWNALGIKSASGKLFKMLKLPFNSKTDPMAKHGIAVADDSMVLEKGRVDNVTNDMFRDIVINNPDDLRGLDVHNYMINLNWKDKSYAKKVEKMRKTGSYNLHCSSPGGKRIKTEDSYAFPSYEPLQNIVNHCLSATSAGQSLVSTAVFLFLACLHNFV